MKRIIVFLYLFGLVLNKTAAQNISNKGKEFWVGYGHHQFMAQNNSMNMTLYLSAEQAATVTIEIDSSGLLPNQWWRRTYNIPANTVVSIDNSATPANSFTASALSWGPIPKGPTNPNQGQYPTSINYDARLVTDAPPAGTGGEGIFRKKGIHIISDVPIVAYCHIYGSVSSGASMLLPVESWGYAYTSINSRQADATDSYNWMFVIAKTNNTVVEITPSQFSRLGKPPGVPFQVTLQKGQIYQLIGQADALGNGVDLTGTTVKVVANNVGICNPVAVFSGSSRTSNPACGSGSSRDNDIQQCFPQQTWGKKYLLAPLSRATGSNNILATSFQTNPYKVVVREPNTVVRRNGVVMAGLQANSYYYFESNQAELIEADKPIMVAQYMSANCIGGGLGDPEMIYWSPIEQGIKQTGFYRNTFEAIDVNYATFIVPTGAVGSFRIDNSSTFNHQYVHTKDPRYTVLIKGWASSKSQSLVTCDSSFVGVTYGLGGAESYGYNAGTFLNNLNAVSDFYNSPDTSRNTVKNHPFGFTNTPMEIGALIRYKPLNIWWKLSAVGGVLSPNADIIQNNPVPIDSVQIAGGWSYRYRLPGNYTFNTAGTYYIPLQLTSDVYGAGDCRNIEDLSIEYVIKPVPTANFTFMVGACSSDSVAFTGPTTTAEGYKVLKWKWTFSNAPGDTSILQNPKAKLAVGNNNVKLDLVVEIGGLASVTKIVNVPGSVNVKWGASSYNICVGQTVTFTDTTVTAGAITNYHWNFGDGGASSIVNTNSNASLTYTFNTVGNFVVKHTVTVPSATCPVDTIPRTINVAAKALVDFNVSANCQPASGLTTFTANLPVGVTATSYTWTFGDPGSGALNTGTGASAPHNYSADGTYAVKLAITTMGGCNGDSTKNVVINRKPQINGSVGVVSPLCDNTLPFDLTVPTIGNGVTGTAITRSFKGGIVNTSGINYNPGLAGFGVDTIYYKFTTTNSCVDSVKFPITVNARPRGNFTISPSNTTCIPLGTNINFTSAITVPNSSVSTYSWFFESPDMTPSKRSSAANPSYNYPEGSYLALLTVTGANGCSFDTSQNITISRAPSIAALVQPDVCETATPFNLTAPTVTGVTGTGSFRSFKNAATSAGLYTPATAGYGVDTIYYRFTTTNNCTDSVKLAINIKARPRGNFTFSPSGCLDASGLVNFTSNVNVPNSTIQTYAWELRSPDMSAGNISNIPNPSHVYNIGTFTIKLGLTGANGCTFDTSQTVTFGKKPAITPLVISDVCENAAPYNLTAPSITNGVTGTGVFSSFKNAATTAGLYTPSTAGYGVDTIYYKYTTGIDCYDSVKTPITIKARPRATFSFTPNGCLSATGTVNFTSNASVPNSTVAGYLWKFDDPNANPSSTLTNPTHNYTVDGTYTIRLTVNGANGCSFDTVQTKAFSKIPSIAPLVVRDTCENINPFIVASAPAITNGVMGTGSFRSFKNAITNSSTGLYNPSIAGYGVDTIYYTFVTPAGCRDSVKAPITIKARPRASFTFSPTGCLNAAGNVTFTSSANVPNSTVSGYLWKFNDPNAMPNSTAPNPTHNYSTEGMYTIRLTINGANGCSFDTLQTQTFNLKPALSAIVQSSFCENTAAFNLTPPTVINGVLGSGVFSSYKGAATSAGLYTPSTAGYGVDTIYYKFTTNSGCSDSTKLAITVLARPRASFNFTPNGCLDATGTVNFTSSANVPNSSVSGYLWKFEDPSTLPTKTSTAANPSQVYNDGTFTIRLTVTGANTCTFDTTRTQTFSKQPLIAPLVVNDTCENVNPYNIAIPAITNGALGTGVFRSFKYAISSAGLYNPSTAGFGVDTVYYIFTTGGGCKDSVKAHFNVKARPRASFTFNPTGCLNTTGTVNFTSSVNVPNSSVNSYLWKFNDPAATPSSTLANPSHNYTSDGMYTIRLTVSGNNACSFDTSLTTTFNRTPDVGPINVTNTCENAANFNVTPAIINNNVTGTGVFTSFKNAISPAGIYTPSTAGAGVDTIYYTFTSTNGGCASTVKTPITIYPKPNANFTVQSNVCLDSLATFTYTASNPGITVTNWQWFYGNGAADNFNNGNPFSRNYNNVGPYEAKLVTVSSFGCLSDTGRQNLTIRPMPVADFTVPAVVCMPNGITQFTNASSVNPTGTLSYNWDFGDPVGSSMTNPNTSTATNPSHIYPSLTPYTVSLRVETAFGCVKNEVKTINPFVLKPNAFIKVNDDTLCQGSISNFIDSSWSTGGMLQNWRWFFGDGGTSSSQNPNYTYSLPGNYTVKLVVTNTAGCVSDTFPKNVLVYLQPVIDAGPSFVVQEGAVIKFAPTANDSTTTSFLWTPAADFTKPDTLRPTLFTASVFPSANATSITKVYRLTAIGLGQCIATDTLTVKILGQLKVPNAFSPNGDGINDVWEIPNLVDYPGATVQVFNRNGQPVFFSNGYNKAWDGKYLGNALPVGTYYYVINPRNGYNLISGSISLLR